MDSCEYGEQQRFAILIVEDHRAVRHALRELMHVAFGAIDVLEAANVGEALRHVSRRTVDIVLMDIKLPGTDGLTGTRMLLERSPRTAVVMVSIFEDSFHRQAAARVGAKRFVSKRTIGKELTGAIEALLAERDGWRAAREPARPADANPGSAGGADNSWVPFGASA